MGVFCVALARPPPPFWGFGFVLGVLRLPLLFAVLLLAAADSCWKKNKVQEEALLKKDTQKVGPYSPSLQAAGGGPLAFGTRLD